MISCTDHKSFDVDVDDDDDDIWRSPATSNPKNESSWRYFIIILDITKHLINVKKIKLRWIWRSEFLEYHVCLISKGKHVVLIM